MIKIDLGKRVLVPANNDRRTISVEEENVCLWVGCEEVCFESEIYVRIRRMREDCCF